MYPALLLIHSILRYVLLVLMLLALARALPGWMKKQTYTTTDRKLALFTVISAHTQLLIGLALYFISPIVKTGLANMGSAMKDRILRFYTVEHISMMIIAIALITIGSVAAKRAQEETKKHKRVFILFLLALLVIFASIPWPFMAAGEGRGWL